MILFCLVSNSWLKGCPVHSKWDSYNLDLITAHQVINVSFWVARKHMKGLQMGFNYPTVCCITCLTAIRNMLGWTTEIEICKGRELLFSSTSSGMKSWASKKISRSLTEAAELPQDLPNRWAVLCKHNFSLIYRNSCTRYHWFLDSLQTIPCEQCLDNAMGT